MEVNVSKPLKLALQYVRNNVLNSCLLIIRILLTFIMVVVIKSINLTPVCLTLNLYLLK